MSHLKENHTCLWGNVQSTKFSGGDMLWVLFSVVLLSACSSKSNTSGIGADYSQTASEFEQYLNIDNQSLAQTLTISALKSRTVNDFFEVNVLLLSTSHKTQKLQYQFTWFDEQGFIVEANKTPWKSLSLHGGQSKNLTAVAPTPRASTFKVYVRGAHSKAYEFE